MTTIVAQNKLSKDQLEAVGLLSIGTILEYFDVCLYIHLSVLLSNLFFPQSDPVLKPFIPAIAFCSSYVLRPLGAIFFGYIGDIFGRKPAILLSTMLAAMCCVVLASLPTYDRIGIAAPIILTICRMLQSISASSEITGVELYLHETIKPPKQYPVVAFVSVLTALGGLCAIFVAHVVTNEKLIPKEWSNDAWRFAFLLGAMVGIVGAVARTSLREASEFADRQKSIKAQFKNFDIKVLQPDADKKNHLKTCVAYFFIYSARAGIFYLLYIHCGEVLKNTFGFTAAEVISNNLLLTLVDIFGLIVLALMSYKVSPLKILKTKWILFFLSLFSFPLAMFLYPSPKTVFLFQCAWALFTFDQMPAAPIFYKYFPVFKRFRYAGILRSCAIVLSYATTSFGLVKATQMFGHNGILLIFVPLGICYGISLTYFERTEKENELLRLAKLEI
jgi:MHS family proline/betaine transporter-like MFS transporter